MQKISILIFITFISIIGNLYSQSNWEEIQRFQETVLVADNRFGSSVSISGNYAIIGSPLDDSEGANAGVVYFYELINGTWVEMQRVTSSDADAGDNFGVSVSISGTKAVVGASNESGTGAAYFFELSGGTWSEVNKVFASDAQNGDGFGLSVSISGTNAVIGANGEDSGGLTAGAAYFFDLSGGTWSEVNKVIASDSQNNDQFGRSVAISGTNAVVGAYLEDTSFPNNGAVYFFELSGGTWSETQKVLASDQENNAQFGISVAISGTNAIVGTWYEDSGVNSDNGAVYFYELNGGTWSEVNKLIASDPDDAVNLGTTVAIDGNYAVSGAREIFNATGNDEGSAYFYKFDGSTWSEINKVKASDAEASDEFGIAVGISGNYALIGARREDTGGNDVGASYFFKHYFAPTLTSFTALANNNLVGDLSVNVDDNELSTTFSFKYGISSGNYTNESNTIILAGDDIISRETAQLNGLTEHQTYFVIAEATNRIGTTISQEEEFTALISTDDVDGDGIIDSLESLAPNSGDGNNDGIQDSQQANIASFESISGSFVTIESITCDYLFNVKNNTKISDGKFEFPFGVLSFSAPCSSAEVKIYFHGIVSLDGFTYRKLLPNDNYGQFENVIFSTETIEDNQVAVATLSLIDGGLGDYDGIVNGVIYDPGGPALPITANIPVWDWWWVIVLFSCVLIIYKRTT